MFQISCIVVILPVLIHSSMINLSSTVSVLGGERDREGGENLDKSASMVY